MDLMLDKTQYENKLLGMALQLNENMAEVVPFISLPKQVFGTRYGRDIHGAICKIVEQGLNVDEITVFENLDSPKSLKLDDLFALTTNWVFLPYFGRLCDNLLKAYNHQKTINEIKESVRLAEQAESAEEAKQTALGRILAIEDVKPEDFIVSASNSLEEAFERTVKLSKMTSAERKKASGVTTGIPGLDKILGGWVKQAVYTVAAGSGRGKSVFGINMAANAARAGYHVLYVSTEMSNTDLMYRLLSAESEVSSRLIKSGDLAPSQIDKVVSAKRCISQYSHNITFFDQPSISLFRLAAITRQVSAKRNLDLIVVDYLQQLQADGGTNREREVSTISDGLCAISRTNDVPVIALSQLNKEGDIRESQTIVFNSYGIIKICYDEDEWAQGNVSVPCEIKVVKHRNGEIGKVNAIFEKGYCRFDEVEYGKEEEPRERQGYWSRT